MLSNSGWRSPRSRSKTAASVLAMMVMTGVLAAIGASPVSATGNVADNCDTNPIAAAAFGGNSFAAAVSGEDCGSVPTTTVAPTPTTTAPDVNCPTVELLKADAWKVRLRVKNAGVSEDAKLILLRDGAEVSSKDRSKWNNTYFTDAGARPGRSYLYSVQIMDNGQVVASCDEITVNTPARTTTTTTVLVAKCATVELVKADAWKVRLRVKNAGLPANATVTLLRDGAQISSRDRSKWNNTYFVDAGVRPGSSYVYSARIVADGQTIDSCGEITVDTPARTTTTVAPTTTTVPDTTTTTSGDCLRNGKWYANGSNFIAKSGQWWVAFICTDGYSWSRSSPIALDVDGSGAVERVSADVEFDFAGDGEVVTVGEWFAPSEGILFSTSIAGPITGQHLFGDQAGLYADGFEKLALLDTNADGQVSGVELDGLALWTDVNTNGVLDAGEQSSMADHGLVSLSTSHTNMVSTATLADGSTMTTEDLWFSTTGVASRSNTTSLVLLGLGGLSLLGYAIIVSRRRRDGLDAELQELSNQQDSVR